MKTYETSKGVNEYIKMCEGYDNSQFRDVLLKHLPKGKSVLEIGMGPGNDYAWLSKLYKVTGSDYSEEFLSRARRRFPEAKLLKLDAISLRTDEKYDAIFSSKVYQHFDYHKLENAIKMQSEILKDEGLIAHAFWVGGEEFDIKDMHFIYHNKHRLIEIIEKHFDILENIEYEEFEKNDSMFIIARKRKG